jgi:excisionase family DNA binding protein
MTRLKPLLTLEEAATYLAVSKTTLRRWTNDGRLACHRVGPRNERRFDPDVLDNFVASGMSEIPDVRPPTIGGIDHGPRGAQADLASRHICLFVGRHEERWEAFRPFFLKHFYAGKPTVYIHSASTREELMDHVRAEGLDPNEVCHRGLLTLIPAQDAYLKNQTFTPEFMVAFMRLQIIRKRADNHPSHLLVGEMDWFFSNAPGVESMHEYEAALNDLLIEHPQTTIVCQYDLSRFAGPDVMKACCSHPGVVYRKRLYQGYYSSNDWSANEIR